MALLLSSQFPPKLTEIVTSSLQEHIRSENSALPSMMHLVLHFCANSSEENSTSIFHTLATTIHLWTRSEQSFLRVAREAFKLSPLSVVSSIEHWVPKYLNSKSGAVREGTEKWLQEAVFEREPISDFPELDTSRVSQTRRLVRVCCTPVRVAYGKEEPRGKHQSTINVLLNAETYLQEVQKAGKVASKSSDKAMRASISKPLSLEIGELQQDLHDLGGFRKLAAAWEKEEPLPSTVRRSVGFESEEETTESDVYEDYEDGSVSPG